ncbi:MAG: VOC family protein [Spirochaetales bacterium]|nr:VOC family protein [Spirochaetales bacterium]
MKSPKVENTIPVLPVKDLDRSLRFYSEKLGFTIDWRGGATASVSIGGCPVMLSENTGSHGPAWVWIGLPDDTLFNTYKMKGVKVSQEPLNHTWAYEMKFEDINGNVLWLATETREDLPLDD